MLCSLPKYKENSMDIEPQRKKPSQEITARKAKSRELLRLLLDKNLSAQEQEAVIDQIKLANASAQVRKDLIINLDKRNRIYEWAVADFIKANFEFSNVFRGAKAGNLSQLSSIMCQNIRDEFTGFDDSELFAVLYYICRIEHEKHPENKVIEMIRTRYLREKVI